MKINNLKTYSPMVFLFQCLTVLFASLLGAQAVTLTLQDGVNGYSAGASTFIRSDNPSTNYNTYLNSSDLVGNTSTGADIRSLFSFDLSSLPSGAQITSITLTLTITSNDPTSVNALQTLDLVALNTAFVDSAATWNTASSTTNWTTAGGDYDSTVLSSLQANPRTIAQYSSLTFDSTAAFVSAAQYSLDSGSLFQFLLKLDDESGLNRNIFFFNGDANSTLSYRPMLTIEYTVPEPTVAFMVILGIVFVYAKAMKVRCKIFSA